MSRRALRGFCVAAGLLCWAAGAAAQDNEIFSADRMSRAQDDIARMDETELRSLTAVLVDCGFLRGIGGTQGVIACEATREKYRIEYERGRGIDEVLFLLMIAKAAQSGGATTLSFVFESDRRPGPITLEEARRLSDQVLSAVRQPTMRLGQDSAPQISLNDITQALAQARNDASQVHLRIGEVEQTLRRKISETFKSRRGQ